MFMLLFVLLSMWRLLLFCYCHVCTRWFYITLVECFCNMHDWPNSPEKAALGDGMLEYNHTSLTWHIMTLPATAPPLNAAGHKLLSNRPQECQRLRHEVKLTEMTVTNMEDRGGDKVFLYAKLHLFLCLTLSHTLLPLSSPSHLSPLLFLPVCRKNPPVKTRVGELNTGVLQLRYWQIRDRILVSACPSTQCFVFCSIFHVYSVTYCDSEALGRLVRLSI